MYRTVDVLIDNEATGRQHSVQQPVAFGFSSDRDSDRIDNYVHLESLTLRYVGGIAHYVEGAIGARNNPQPIAGKP